LDIRPEAGNVHAVVRRRRSRRHRRNRLIRRVLLFTVVLALGIGISSVALPYLSPSLFHASRSSAPSRQAAESSRELLVAAQQESVRNIEGRSIYPYSVVPGGVKDARELKWAAEHDPVVAAHYAGFDYDRARVVRLVLARTAYVSYRIGSKVYWTRHRVSLKAGEILITDGKITARSRCANRVEQMPQQATSSSEPPATKFEEPIAPAVGTAVAIPPVPFDSALMNRQPLPGLGPAPPLPLYDPFGGGNWTPINPPPLPSGVCEPVKKKTTTTGGFSAEAEAASTVKKKIPTNPCSSGGGTVPEPGSWLLVASGLALMYWLTRKRLVRT
jgi:hypothetical protein